MVSEKTTNKQPDYNKYEEMMGEMHTDFSFPFDSDSTEPSKMQSNESETNFTEEEKQEEGVKKEVMNLDLEC